MGHLVYHNPNDFENYDTIIHTDEYINMVLKHGRQFLDECDWKSKDDEFK